LDAAHLEVRGHAALAHAEERAPTAWPRHEADTESTEVVTPFRSLGARRTVDRAQHGEPVLLGTAISVLVPFSGGERTQI
jgi:hypothetical protein